MESTCIVYTSMFSAQMTALLPGDVTQGVLCSWTRTVKKRNPWLMSNEIPLLGGSPDFNIQSTSIHINTHP